MVHYSNFDGIEITVEEKAKPTTGRDRPSLVNFKNRFIFVSGGSNPQNWDQYYRSVEYYDIATDTWSAAAPLNKARSYHSSCCMGDFIYVFCGQQKGGRFTDTIERLDAESMINGNALACWELT